MLSEYFLGSSFGPVVVVLGRSGVDRGLRVSAVCTQTWTRIRCSIGRKTYSHIYISIRYDIALLYLEQANYDLELAMGVYKDDERWEKENPILDRGKGKGKAKTKGEVGRRRFTGQRS